MVLVPVALGAPARNFPEAGPPIAIIRTPQMLRGLQRGIIATRRRRTECAHPKKRRPETSERAWGPQRPRCDPDIADRAPPRLLRACVSGVS